MEKEKILWGADAIARDIGRSADFVRRTLAEQPGTPVRKFKGRLYAIESELISFFRAQAPEEHN